MGIDAVNFDFIRANLTPAKDTRLFGVRGVFDTWPLPLVI